MKFFKNKLAVTIIVLSVTFLGVIVYSVKSDKLSVFSSATGTALNPVQKLFFSINDKIKNEVQYLFNFSNIRKENDDLKKRNVELENQLIEYDSLKKQNDDFRKVLNFADQNKAYNYVGTSIIGVSGGSFTNGYFIDKGTDQGLTKDMVVISELGLVGKITEVHNNWSKIETLINENIAVVGKDVTTNESGIVQGFVDSKNNNLAKIEQLPINSTIKAGDVITTSGLGKAYPSDIRIGQVTSVEEDKVKVMKTATIKPYVDFNKLQSLFVLIPKEKRNITDDGVKY
ncbi:rod shape-determining protein MreC [Inconstantimicrobium mannanitabidum]|uniref:Cell shape-determining protein MreC n=1 Tax=Inconstantimicrobium mannanitabidum TaxID=1604901 RepID=A0ACB5R7F1_9CLOT|nr:rod shape-determining protein MreC [Clostridium sp. TW13]GKX65114.1 cell shape-determining protein MreC [Clostridium sp. TW13]